MAECIMNTASATLFGKDVREKFDTSFASLFHDLDGGFAPINFLFPRAPLPHNRRRDNAQKKMAAAFMEIIEERRKHGANGSEKDLIFSLIDAPYKDGTTITDQDISHLLIGLLLAGQHSTSSTSSWIMTWLACYPELIEDLYQEQISLLGKDLSDLTSEGLQRLPLSNGVIKETLRLNTPVHSILRRATSPLPVDGTDYVIPTGHNLLASPGFLARQAQYFPDPLKWDPHRWDVKKDGGAAQLTAERGEKVDYGYGAVTKYMSNPFLPFGAGRHRCIGESFAFVQIATTLAMMVRTFKWQRVDMNAPMVKTDYSVSLHYHRRLAFSLTLTVYAVHVLCSHESVYDTVGKEGQRSISCICALNSCDCGHPSRQDAVHRQAVVWCVSVWPGNSEAAGV